MNCYGCGVFSKRLVWVFDSRHSLYLFQYDHNHDGLIPLVDLSQQRNNHPALDVGERHALYKAYERKPDTAIDFGAFTRIVSWLFMRPAGVPVTHGAGGFFPRDIVGTYGLCAGYGAWVATAGLVVRHDKCMRTHTHFDGLFSMQVFTCVCVADVVDNAGGHESAATSAHAHR
jgi:hypothetical protein